MKTSRLRFLMAELRRELPTDLPVRVIQRKRVKTRAIGEPGWVSLFGYVIHKPDHHRIVLSSALTEGHATDVLAHEYAHILARAEQKRAKSEDHHDEIWGREFARAYSAVTEDIHPI